jgi:NAD-dependent dihydropyrimidine dehydrogenase PreA subunit
MATRPAGASPIRTSSALYREWRLLAGARARGSPVFKHANRAWSDWAIEHGLHDGPVENIFQLYLEPLRKFQLAAEGKIKPVPPEHHRARIRTCFDPLPTWYPPFAEDGLDEDAFPLHAITQRPAAMYHSWGSQNAWLRQIHGENALYVPGDVCDSQGLETGDWALVSSQSGEIRVKIARMDAVNGSTLWTWNAIGKRAGAWALDKDAPEATRGFLLNHLIDELLPPKGDGRAGPIPTRSPARRPGSTFGCRSAGIPTRPTGKACPMPARKTARSDRAGQCGLRTGESPMTSLPQGTEKRLGLVIDLDTCVGCHACAVNCKEWNTGAGASPLADADAYGADVSGHG